MSMADDYYTLDERYTSGIWYDPLDGTFAKIQQGQSDGERIVELVNPNNGHVYYDMPVSEWVEKEQSNFYPINEEAVDDPAAVIEAILDDVLRGHDPTIEQCRDLRYAIEQVTIEEID